MGTTIIEQFSLNMLMPAQQPQDARLESVAFGPNLTIPVGMAIAQKASDNKCYPLNATAGTNEVQTVAHDATMTAGVYGVVLYDYLGVRQEVKVAFNSSWTQTVADIATALNALLGASAVVLAVTNTHDMTITFSGTHYAGLAQAPVEVDISGATSVTKATITRTTPGGDTDGTQLFKGWNQYSLVTDAGGNIYLNDTTTGPSYRLTPKAVAPIWVAGIFDPQDLQTNGTPVAEVDTFTATNPTTNDVYTLTITFPNLTTYAVSATVGATQTATAIDALLKAAWNADPVASLYAVATGTATLILTAVKAGNTLSIAGSVVGTGTIAKVVTTGTSGRSLADVLPGAPGARVMANGFWYFP